MPPMMVEAIEMGEMPFITEDIHEFHMAPDGDTESKVWIHKSADGDVTEKMKIAVLADDADIGEGVTMIKVKAFTLIMVTPSPISASSASTAIFIFSVTSPSALL